MDPLHGLQKIFQAYAGVPGWNVDGRDVCGQARYVTKAI